MGGRDLQLPSNSQVQPEFARHRLSRKITGTQFGQAASPMRRPFPLLSVLATVILLLGLCNASLPNSQVVATGNYALNQYLGLTQISLPVPGSSTREAFIYNNYMNTSNGNDFVNNQIQIVTYTPRPLESDEERSRFYVMTIESPLRRTLKDKKGNPFTVARFNKDKVQSEWDRYQEYAAKRRQVGVEPLPPYPLTIDYITYNVSMLCGSSANEIFVQQNGCTQLTFAAGVDFCEDSFMSFATSAGPFQRGIGLSNGHVAFSLGAFMGSSWNYFYECQSSCDTNFTNVCYKPT
jgi:hypothetical protein